jgi:two-component system, NtrC family, sensor kinase
LKLAHQEREITAQKVTNLAAFQQVLLKREQRLSVLEKEKIQTKSKIRSYVFLIGLIVLSVIGFILYRNNLI